MKMRSMKSAKWRVEVLLPERTHMEDEVEDENEKEDERDGEECKVESRREIRATIASDVWIT